MSYRLGSRGSIFVLSILVLLSCWPNRGFSQVPPPLRWLMTPIYNPGALAFSPNGLWAAIGGVGGSAIYRVSTGASRNLQDDTVFRVNSVVFSPNSRYLAVSGINGNSNGILELWDVETASRFATLNVPSSRAPAISFSPNGLLLAVGGFTPSYQGFLELWNVASRTKVKSLNTKNGSTGIQFSPDGKTLASLTGNQVELWDLPSVKLRSTLDSQANGDSPAMSLSPDGKTLAFVSNTQSAGVLELWDLSTGKLAKSLSTPTTPYLSSVAFSSDQRTLAVSTTTGSLELWNTTTGEMTSSWQTQVAESGSAIAFSANGRILAEVGVNFVNSKIEFSSFELWDASTHRLMKRIYTDQPHFVSSLAFSSDGKLVANSAATWSDEPAVNEVDVWEASTGKQRAKLKTSANIYVNALAFAPGGKKLVVAGSSLSPTQTQSAVLELWDTSSGDLLANLETGMSDSANSMAISPDGKTLVVGLKTGNGNGQLAFYDSSTGQRNSVFSLQPWASPGPLAFSLDGKTIAVTYFGSIWIWSVESNAFVRSFSTGQANIKSISFSPDGLKFAAGETSFVFGIGDVGRIQIWDIATGTGTNVPGTSFQGIGPTVAFSSDSQYLFTNLGSDIDAYSMVNGSLQTIATWPIPFINTIALNPLGTDIALGGIGRSGLALASNPLAGLVSLDSITTSPNTVVGGRTTTLTVSLSHPAPKIGATVALVSSSNKVTVPSTITILPGKSSVTFTINTGRVRLKTTATITASVGLTSRLATLMIF